MSERSAKDVVEEMLRRQEAGDDAVLDDLVAEDMVNHAAGPQGRAGLRERVAVEHTLAHVGRWQGRRARYRGQRKNLFDLRRVAVVHNLHLLQRHAAPDGVAA
jgi:ketosteroid isomerase-like protein